MKVSSTEEIAARRAADERALRGWIEAFVLFPSEDNLIGIVTGARGYQSAWMHDVAIRAQDQRRPSP